MVKVGIIGCGKIAQVRHIPEYLDNPNAKLTGLYDLNLQRAKDLAEKYGCKSYESIEDMLADPEIDAVSVCAANHVHAEITTAALKAGKHVLCEKPMATKLKDCQMIRMGQAIILAGIIVMILPFGKTVSLIGFSLIGLGCAPVYPCIIHSTPSHFGAERSQAIIGVQMASAYVGTCLMPPLFGLIANHISIRLLPVYLLILLALMVYMHELLERKC